MKRLSLPFFLVGALALASGAAHSQQLQGTPMTPAPIVFFDIAGPDAAKQQGFYKEVFGWEADPTGGVKVQIAGPPLSGLLRTDPADKVIYLGVKDVTATLAEIVKHGGQIHAPRFEVKGVVILGLFRDPAGNFMGLVEMGEDGKNKIP
jgi:predicted enzyme related to lactoylglutathione lyase